MNKLSEYQTAANWTRKAGGPKVLGGVIFGAGLLTGALLTAAAWLIVDHSREEESKKESIKKNNTFEVTAPGIDESGLSFEAGDTFTVLSKRNGSVSILRGDEDSEPVYVSDDFLKSISGTYSLY